MATTSESTANSTVTSATADGGTEREQEHGNAATAAPAEVQQQEEGEELIGPGPAPARQRQKRPLQFEQAFLDALPSAAMCVSSSSPFTAIGFVIRLCLLPGAAANCGGGCLLQVREELYA